MPLSSTWSVGATSAPRSASRSSAISPGRSSSISSSYRPASAPRGWVLELSAAGIHEPPGSAHGLHDPAAVEWLDQHLRPGQERLREPHLDHGQPLHPETQDELAERPRLLGDECGAESLDELIQLRAAVGTGVGQGLLDLVQDHEERPALTRFRRPPERGEIRAAFRAAEGLGDRSQEALPGIASQVQTPAARGGDRGNKPAPRRDDLPTPERPHSSKIGGRAGPVTRSYSSRICASRPKNTSACTSV